MQTMLFGGDCIVSYHVWDCDGIHAWVTMTSSESILLMHTTHRIVQKWMHVANSERTKPPRYAVDTGHVCRQVLHCYIACECRMQADLTDAKIQKIFTEENYGNTIFSSAASKAKKPRCAYADIPLILLPVLCYQESVVSQLCGDFRSQ
jgi:hypothetical protein